MCNYDSCGARAELTWLLQEGPALALFHMARAPLPLFCHPRI